MRLDLGVLILDSHPATFRCFKWTIATSILLVSIANIMTIIMHYVFVLCISFAVPFKRHIQYTNGNVAVLQ